MGGSYCLCCWGALVVPVLLSGCRSKKEVINRESEVRVDSSLNSSSGEKSC